MQMGEIARALGKLGGESRARRLSSSKKSEIAAMGGKSRARSLLAEKRIVENFRYVSAMRALEGGASPITRRVKSCRNRLPGLYAKA